MKEFFVTEYRRFASQIKALDFRLSVIFLSVAFITFVSIYYAQPSFFRKLFDTDNDKFYSTIYWFLADGLLMFIVPVFIIILFFKQKVTDYGLRKGDVFFGIRSTVIFLIIMLPVIWIVTGSESFIKTYPQSGYAVKESYLVLAYYELFVGFYMFAWEFFWRGYVLFGLKQRFGFYSVFIQMIPFFILHKGKPEIEVFASIFAGLILGYQALRANSFIYCFLTHWGVMISIDTLSVFRYRSGVTGIGFNDFYNLLFR